MHCLSKGAARSQAGNALPLRAPPEVAEWQRPELPAKSAFSLRNLDRQPQYCPQGFPKKFLGKGLASACLTLPAAAPSSGTRSLAEKVRVM